MGNPFKALYERIADQGSETSVTRGVQAVKVVAFYTNDSYQKEIEPLHRSLVKFGVSHQTYRLNGPHTWFEAVCAKPRFIYECLQNTKADAIFYTDADSSFVAKPDWAIFNGADVGWHFFERVPGNVPEFLTGSMFFRNKPEVILFLRDWASETETGQYKSEFTPEQRSLEKVWHTMGWRLNLKHADPGPAYCFIDDMKPMYPNVSPVIIHRQASRLYRHAEEKAPTEIKEAKT